MLRRTVESGGIVLGSVTWSPGSFTGRVLSAARNCLAKSTSFMAVLVAVRNIGGFGKGCS